MIYFRLQLALVLLFILSLDAHTQSTADSLWLDEVQVSASRIDILDTYQSVSSFRIDSAMLVSLKATSVSDVLQYYSPLFIRNNGPGGLSTVNSRGFSSSQTQFIWNGFPLNHSMLGVTDLSIIPISTVSELLTSSGSGNTSFGDRGGGTIAIQTKGYKEKVALYYQIGSFGEQKYSVEAGAHVSKVDVNILAGFQSSDNDFKYSIREFSNDAGGFISVRKKRLYNENESASVLVNIRSDIKRHEFQTKLWILDSENQIPGGISSVNDAAFQNDGFVRWLTHWQLLQDKTTYNGSLYIARQSLDYIDANASINSLSDIQSNAIDFSIKSVLNNRLQIISAIRAIRNKAITSEYPTDVQRDELSVNVNLVWTPTDFLFIYPAIHGNYNTDYGVNYSAELGLNTELVKEQLFLKVNAARNYVAPTFNDLYWPGLGNPELEIEEVVKMESSLLHKLKISNWSVETKVLGYISSIENGIRWLPNGQGESAPQNIESLDLSGIEWSSETRWNTKTWGLRTGIIITQVLASISEERFENDASVGKQLIYTPEWQYKANVSFRFKQLTTSAFYNFVDDRYSSSDHSSPFDPLSSYQTLDMVASIKFMHKLAEHSLQITIRNVFDEEYSVIRDYPLPGRHLKISIITNF